MWQNCQIKRLRFELLFAVTNVSALTEMNDVAAIVTDDRLCIVEVKILAHQNVDGLFQKIWILIQFVLVIGQNQAK